MALGLQRRQIIALLAALSVIVLFVLLMTVTRIPLLQENTALAVIVCGVIIAIIGCMAAPRETPHYPHPHPHPHTLLDQHSPPPLSFYTNDTARLSTASQASQASQTSLESLLSHNGSRTSFLSEGSTLKNVPVPSLAHLGGYTRYPPRPPYHLSEIR